MDMTVLSHHKNKTQTVNRSMSNNGGHPEGGRIHVKIANLVVYRVDKH